MTGLASQTMTTPIGRGFLTLNKSYANIYWTDTGTVENSPSDGYAYFFYFERGQQGGAYKHISQYAWAVRDGDVGQGEFSLGNTTVASEPPATVPVPAAAWLFVSGFLGLIGVARRKAA